MCDIVVLRTHVREPFKTAYVLYSSLLQATTNHVYTTVDIPKEWELNIKILSFTYKYVGCVIMIKSGLGVV